MTYAELAATSNFTFLTGASHPEELVARAEELGLPAIAITDRNTFAGIVRGHAAAKELAVRYIVGTRLVLTDGPDILAYPKSRKGYGNLCRLLTTGKRRAAKGRCEIGFQDVLEWAGDCALIVAGGNRAAEAAHTLKRAFRDEAHLGASPQYDGEDRSRFARRAALADKAGVPLVAMGDAIMHSGRRRRLADVLSCIREKTAIDRLGRKALPNAERRIKSEFEIRRLFSDHPDAVRNAGRIADRCRFSLDKLKYEYPDEVTDGMQPDDRLRRLTESGLRRRYPGGTPSEVRATVEKELKLIAELDYARYFLTVCDVVKFARSKGILCQGRGSAANSAVCFALGITEASPEVISMVFERFISEARKEPPDIDVDFEHERREEVIQHVYEKYGRHRAGICSTVVHFRSRAAIREVGKAMGLSEDAVATLSAHVRHSIKGEPTPDPGSPRLRRMLELAKEITGFPRHLSQHVGGFVITRGRLDELCPVENAAMEDRTIIEWDKDDIDAIGMLKVDILALGMLTCLRKSLDLLRGWKGERHTLATIPQEDPAVYDMLCAADTVGVFQIESRAQMNFLPRLRPRTFYDLVIEVAIIRPGPIQGEMLHPYIKRRRGEEPVTYPSEALAPVLKKTLGVPLFQEQAMQIAIAAAGFTAGEADQLRRSFGKFGGKGTVEAFRKPFMEGCRKRGYDSAAAENCFKQLEGFSAYGFPESHAASFALLAYASSWMKCHHPEVFCCALLNSQPMGFYASAQIIRDAREHGVPVLPVCVEHSYWDNALEPAPDGTLAVRLGFRQITGFKKEDGAWLSAARGNGYRSIESVWRRAGLDRKALERLASADAFAAHGLSRRDALWAVKGLGGERPMPLFEAGGDEIPEGPSPLPVMSEVEEVYEDYVSMRLTLRGHPVSLLRPQLGRFRDAASMRSTPDGRQVTVVGLVITRQRPGTASGVIFLTLEDDTGVSNIVVWPNIFKRCRKSVMAGRLLRVAGKLQREGIVTHVIASRIDDLSHLLDGMADGPETAAEPGLPGPPLGNAKSSHAPDALARELARAGNPDIRGGLRHPREQSSRLFRSRDFH